MVTVHHLENSRSQRILWLLEELGVSYDIKRYERDATTRLAPPELLEIHPLGKSPVVTAANETLAESGAIVEYLLGKHPDTGLLPKGDSPERLAYTYWLHYAEGTFMPYMVMSLVVNRIETAKMPFFAKPIAKGIARNVRASFLTPNITRNLTHMENTLAATGWFAGCDMSGADIMMSFPVEAAAASGALGEGHGNLRDFLARIQARPAYQRALEKGGPYELLR